MNTEMFAADSQMRLMTMNDATGTDLTSEKQGPQQMLQHGDAAGGEAEQYAGQKRQQEAGRDPREGEQHRAPEIRLEHERGKTAQHRCGGGEEKLLPHQPRGGLPDGQRQQHRCPQQAHFIFVIKTHHPAISRRQNRGSFHTARRDRSPARPSSPHPPCR